MLNKVCLEGYCQRNTRPIYYDMFFKKTPLFICPFKFNGHKNRYYIYTNIFFIGDMAKKAYEQLKDNSIYIVVGKLTQFVFVPNLQDPENKLRDFMKIRSNEVVGYKLYKSCRNGKNKNEELYKETPTGIDTEGLELIAESIPPNTELFEKRAIRTNLKEQLKQKGIVYYEDEDSNEP